MQHGILYQFPRVATIKFHKLDDLKQQKFIVSEFQRPAVQNQSLAAPLKTSETQRGKSFPASFQFLMVTISSWHSLASNCITPLSAYVITCNSLCVSLSVTAFHSYKAIRLTGCVCGGGGGAHMHVHMCACTCVSCSVMSNYLQPPGLQPTRILCPQNFPGKSTGGVAIPFSRGSS